MPSVFFTFTPASDDSERLSVLRRLQAAPGVINSERLSPDAPHDDVRRLAYVEVDSDERAREILNRLRADPAVEAADPPAARGPA